jgi:tetratricopeptide (TPR) repeat protein
MDCKHGAAPNRCQENCPNNVRNSLAYKKANQAIKSGKASYDEWIAHATTFDSSFEFEKAEACTRCALLSLGGSQALSKKVSLTVGNLLMFKLKSKNLVGVHPLRIRAALEEAKQSLYGIYEELDENTKKAFLSEFKKDRVALDSAIQQTSYSGASAVMKVAKLFRPRKSYAGDRFSVPEVALDLYLRALAANPEDPYLLVGIAAVYNDLRRWEDAIAACHKALELEHSERVIYPTLCKALMYSGSSMEAWSLLQELKVTKENRIFILAQKIICLFRMEVDCNWDDEDLKHISSMRQMLAEEIKEWEGSSQNPRALQHATLNALIDSMQFGAAWAYLSELESEGWRGNGDHWRQQITLRAQAERVDLSLEIAKSSPPVEDAFPDSDD